MVSLFGLDPRTYTPHALHGADRAYPENNCYVDIVIELLHARGDEPLAVLGHTVRTDFEGDQWTFVKPPPHDLEELYGVDIHEMQPYRPAPDQIAEQIADGRTVIFELDSWYLPDTAGTAYRTEHVKSAAAMESIDLVEERLRYFHNRSLHELSGDDFRGVLRMEGAPADRLPPYTELVRFDRGRRRQGAGLRSAARALVRGHLDLAPSSNPFDRFAARLATDLPALVSQDIAAYHAYAFATVRMAGSAFGLCSAHVGWLYGADGARCVDALDRLVETSKVMSFKLARRRDFDPGPLLDGMREAWETAMEDLDRLAGPG